MFTWIFDWFQDRNIAADFAQVETAARAAFVKQLHAERDIKALESKRASLLGHVRAEEKRRFGQQQTRLEQQGAALRQQINAAESTLTTLTRDYRTELDALYADLSAAKDELNELYAQKQAAYDDLNEAREGLERWYNRSERTYCFGNGGRELPTHALFGQSLGDRACLQGDRDDAYEEVRRCREAIAEAKGARQAIYEEIQALKQARQEMFDLKRAGQTRHSVEQELRTLNNASAGNRLALQKVKQACADFTHDQRETLGVAALEARLQALRDECTQGLSAYDAPSAREARRQAHRAEWLRRNA